MWKSKVRLSQAERHVLIGTTWRPMRLKWGEWNTDSRWQQKGSWRSRSYRCLVRCYKDVGIYPQWAISSVRGVTWLDMSKWSLCLLVGNKLKGGKHVSGDLIWALVEPSLWLEGTRILSVVQIEWANRETTIEKITEHFFVKRLWCVCVCLGCWWCLLSL